MPNIFQKLTKALRGKQYSYTMVQGVGNPTDFNTTSVLTSIDKALLYWAYIAIDMIAKQFFSLEYSFFDSNGKEIQNKDIDKFFQRPNPFETAPIFFYRIAYQLEVTGKSFIRKREDDGEVNFYILNDPTAMTIVKSDDGSKILKFRYRTSNMTIEYDPSEIIFLRYPHPFLNFEGYGRLQAILEDLNLQIDVKRIMREILSRSVPRQAITVEDYTYASKIKEVLTLSKIQNSIPILPKANSIPLERTPQELQIIEINKAIRDTILQEFGVPPSIVGVYQDVNRANALASEQTFIRNTILPRVKFIEQFLNIELVREVLKLDGWLELKIPYQYDEELELRKLEVYLRNGVVTINEVRAMEGLAPMPWGDHPYMPASYIPLAFSGQANQKTKENVFEYNQKKTINDIHEKNWYSTIKSMSKTEPHLVKEWKTIFKMQREEILSKLLGLKNFYGMHKQIDQFIISILNGVSEEREEQIRELLSELYQERTNAFALVYDLTPPQVSPALINAVMNKTIKIDLINEATLRELREAIHESIIEGESVEELAQRINGIFDFYEEFRAVRIARTELIGVSNMASLDTMIANDVEYKEWFTALDELVRPSHRALHGQIRRINEKFYSPVTGSELLYPGDPDADPGEVINCRCIIVPAEGGEVNG